MAEAANWVDLVDPDADEIRAHAPSDLHPRALEELTRAMPDRLPRPAIEGHGDYVFGILLAAVAVTAEDRVFYQEIDFVLTRDRLLTVRKTPAAGAVFPIDRVERVCAMRERVEPGMIAFHLVDEVAEGYLDLLDALEGEIDELELHAEDWTASQVQRRLAELRRDVIEIRRLVGPTRAAVRGIVDGRTDLEGRPLFRREVFPREVELHFAQAHDRLLRADERLDFARDLIASAREYHQSTIATEQNRVTRRLTAVAALLLFPTFWVGVYGQNFEHIPELGWRHGYAFSWAVIVVVTVLQLVYFRRRGWL